MFLLVTEKGQILKNKAKNCKLSQTKKKNKMNFFKIQYKGAL